MLADLLRLEPHLLGADDELLAFGFSSLLGMKLIARLEERHGVRLTHGALLEARTLRSLAVQVAAARTTAAAASEAPPEVAGAPESPRWPLSRWPLSIGQRALWLLQELAPGSTAYHVPCALRWHGPLDVTRLRAALAHLWRRHPLLRARIEEVGDGDGPIQIIDPDRAPPFTVHAPAGDPGALLARLVEAPFDLRRGPLARIDLLAAAGAEAPILLFTAHHLVVDGSRSLSSSASWRSSTTREARACARRCRRPAPRMLRSSTGNAGFWRRRRPSVTAPSGARASGLSRRR